ncbi:hypothetical protein, partial [Klebsiella pneumoniae]|uniref:hypothetical protein n=1 Tax=Klebsiella pneumoniae TaxID=573 RepID=UPI0039C1C645
VDIQLRQHATNAQPLARRQQCIAITEEQLASALVELVWRCGEGEVRQLAVIEPITALGAL